MNTATQADVLKNQGNRCFKKERFAAAIDAYTEVSSAIALRPDVAVYWTNRALCHRKRNDWERMEADCRRALELDKNFVKARYMLGVALRQRKRLTEAAKELDKALELARDSQPGNYIIEEVWNELAKARFREWEYVALPRQRKQKKLRRFCERALKQDYELAVQRLNDVEKLSKGRIDEEPEVIVIEDGEVDCSISPHAPDTPRYRNFSDENNVLEEDYQKRQSVLRDVFDKAGECDMPSEVPGYLTCKITMDLLRDPVITPSGVTYERAVLLEHLQKVGKFDPVTRAPLQPEQLVPNLAVKQALQLYLLKHGWAYNIN